MAAALQIELPMDAIERLCRKYRVAELSVFGSALRPDFRKNSDIDLLVAFRPEAEIGLIAFLGFQRELSETLGRKVDLVPKNGLKPLVRDEILAQAQVLYAA
ncbi:MAG: nucleotidyltransferase family protein [Acidobacteria bacterium]|nr:nucleotidyltransferase family protein [Acidobacteriota bacterium]